MCRMVWCLSLWLQSYISVIEPWVSFLPATSSCLSIFIWVKLLTQKSMWLRADTPALALKQMAKSGKRGRVPLHWQPGLTAVSGDTSVFSNTDKTISVISKQEKSHTSPPLPDPTSLFHWWSTWSCPHDPAPALAFISLIFTQR